MSVDKPHIPDMRFSPPGAARTQACSVSHTRWSDQEGDAAQESLIASLSVAWEG